jgi:hypothetical protein
MNWLDIDDAHHTLSHEPDKNKDAYDKLGTYQYLVCRGTRIPPEKTGNTPEPGQKGCMLDHTLLSGPTNSGRVTAIP